jgi:hypothetical protein
MPPPGAQGLHVGVVIGLGCSEAISSISFCWRDDLPELVGRHL